MVTTDLLDFGIIELKEAGELLTALKTDKDKTEYLGDGVQLAFNSNSGCVFLSDEDYNVAMINPDTGNLEDFFSCPICGAEGFKDDVCDMENHSDPEDEECKEWIEDIQ